MSSIADFLQVAASSLPSLLLATVLMFASYVGRGWIDGRAVAGARKRAAEEASAEAAAETAVALRLEYQRDQAAFRNEQRDRISELEDRIEREQQECAARLDQRVADHAQELAHEEANHAQARAEEASRYAEQLAALRAENATCKEQVATLRADLTTWQKQAERLAEIFGEAGRAVRPPPGAIKADV